MSNKKKLLPRANRRIDCIIVDDFNDDNIAVSPAVVAERLKRVQASLPYEEAKRIAQNECDAAYNKVIPYNHPMWDKLKETAPAPFNKRNLNQI